MPKPPSTRSRSAKPAPPPKPNQDLKARLRLKYGADIAMGPGKADLLEQIRDTGSIAAAGRAMGISYKRAWVLVTTMNNCFAEPLVTASRGGTIHGSSILTPTGEAILAAYRRLAKTIEGSKDLAMIRRHLAVPVALRGRSKTSPRR
jgi:molybdate transport system regulatory protein